MNPSIKALNHSTRIESREEYRKQIEIDRKSGIIPAEDKREKFIYDPNREVAARGEVGAGTKE